jgi:hypothetical protein
VRIKLSILLVSLVTVSSISFESPGNSSSKSKRSIASDSIQVKQVQSSKSFENSNKESRIKITNEKYLEASKYPHTSSPVDHRNSSNYLAERFKISNSILEENGTSVNLWLDKKIYNAKRDMVKIHYSVVDGESLGMELFLIIKEKKYKLKSKKINNNSYLSVVDPKELIEDDYRIILEIDGHSNLTANFGVRKHYFDFMGVTKDSISSTGDLIIKSKVNVLIAGDYLVEGTLYANGEQIALAESIQSLNMEDEYIDLSFYGKIIYDKKIDGELELRNLSISYIRPSLATRSLGLIKTKYKTAFYKFDQFHHESFNNKLLLAKIRDF